MAVRIQEPTFESQTKVKLGSDSFGPDGPTIRQGIISFLRTHLDNYLHRHPATVEAILKRILQSERERTELKGIQKIAKARAKKARVVNRKLRDCKVHYNTKHKLADLSSIFITEGDSASGSITKSRDPMSQAVFSLRGKPLNTYGMKRRVIYENEEFYLLQDALDIEDGLENLRYNYIILATDADVDGFHIRILLMCYFLQFFPELVRRGHLFILQTPLFRVRNKKDTVYCYSEAEKTNRHGYPWPEGRGDPLQGSGGNIPIRVQTIYRREHTVGTGCHWQEGAPRRHAAVLHGKKHPRPTRLYRKEPGGGGADQRQHGGRQRRGQPGRGTCCGNGRSLTHEQGSPTGPGSTQGYGPVQKILPRVRLLRHSRPGPCPPSWMGLKPVQRRILATLFKLNDGRFHKVASIVGETMKLHPHGDAAISDALVQIAQRNLLIDTQGNFGDPITGDRAAASRYIEARLSKFALAVLFNPKTTEFQDSYDGRNKEPVVLPAKFPLALAQGIEGIAVGLACKIFPHNFLELIDASIAHLRKEDFELYPDFPSGGLADVSDYNEGLRGGRIRLRAKIDILKGRKLVIREIPFGTTTGSLIDSIVNAREKGKIKFTRIEDHTAEKVEILIHGSVGIDPQTMINALYAFTQCEVSLSPNSCIIENNRPEFLSVKELLRRSVVRTKALLKMELQIELGELQEKWHRSSLEKIFIENRIYRDIEECTTWESVIATIDRGLKPFHHLLRRTVTREDVIRLTEIRIKRISRYDAFKADEYIKGLEDRMKKVNRHLRNLTRFTIQFYRNLRNNYGRGRERKTLLTSFAPVDAAKVAVGQRNALRQSQGRIYRNGDEA